MVSNVSFFKMCHFPIAILYVILHSALNYERIFIIILLLPFFPFFLPLSSEIFKLFFLFPLFRICEKFSYSSPSIFYSYLYSRKNRIVSDWHSSSCYAWLCKLFIAHLQEVHLSHIHPT